MSALDKALGLSLGVSRRDIKLRVLCLSEDIGDGVC